MLRRRRGLICNANELLGGIVMKIWIKNSKKNIVFLMLQNVVFWGGFGWIWANVFLLSLRKDDDIYSTIIPRVIFAVFRTSREYKHRPCRHSGLISPYQLVPFQSVGFFRWKQIFNARKKTRSNRWKFAKKNRFLHVSDLKASQVSGVRFVR